MAIGTRSLLFGTHQVILHPVMVAIAWARLYGFPRDWRLWLAFVVHDWGYWGKPNMDGPEGQDHPFGGGCIVLLITKSPDWATFTMNHSRYYAAKYGDEPSALMRADKMATVLTPYWLYIALAWLSGEYHEYIAFHNAAGYPCEGIHGWARSLRALWREHYDRREGRP